MRIFDFFLIFIIPQFLFAQYNPVIIGVEQGLSQSAVRSIAQDSEGFLWIATWDGLNRYDGHTFVNYNHNPGSKSSLSNNNLIHLTFDGTDRPWVTAISGEINLLNKRTNTFSLLRDKQGKPLTANYNGFPVNFDDAHMVFLSPSGVILTRTSDLVSTKLIEVKKNEFTNMNGKVLAVFHTEKDLLLVNNLRKVTKIPLEFRIIFTSTLKK
jgi:ligand-binding sensor domain-containing protein